VPAAFGREGDEARQRRLGDDRQVYKLTRVLGRAVDLVEEGDTLIPLET
jgi:hypothetical protein